MVFINVNVQICNVKVYFNRISTVRLANRLQWLTLRLHAKQCHIVVTCFYYCHHGMTNVDTGQKH